MAGRESRVGRSGTRRRWGALLVSGLVLAGPARPAAGQSPGQPVSGAAGAPSPLLRSGGGLAVQATFGEPTSAGSPTGNGQTEPDGETRSYTLERAVGIALRNNRQLAVSQYDLATANKQVSEAYGGLLPEVDGTASLQRNLTLPQVFLPAFIFDPSAPPDELVPVTFGADNQWAAGLTVSQPLFDAGVFVGVGTAGAFRDLAREGLRGTAQQVATSTRIAYLNVLLAQEAVRVTRNSIERVRQTLTETRALNRAGLASDYDVLRLEVQLANIEPNLRRSANDRTEAQRLLAIEMGIGGTDGAAALGELHRIDLTPGANNDADNLALLRFTGSENTVDRSLEELQALALRHRTDLEQARLQRRLEEARVSFERTQLFPRISAFFNWSLQAQEDGALDFFGDSPSQRTTASAVGVQLEVPIFEGGRRWNRVQQRKIGVRQVEERIADLTQRARNDVETVLNQLSEARARAAAQRKAVGEAQRGYDIVRTEYLAGIQPRLEVTGAELALRQAEQNYALAVYDYLAARATLDLVLGVVPGVDPVVEAMVEGEITPEDRVGLTTVGDAAGMKERGDR